MSKFLEFYIQYYYNLTQKFIPKKNFQILYFSWLYIPLAIQD